MTKVVKFKNDVCLDSKAICHDDNGTLLNSIIYRENFLLRDNAQTTFKLKDKGVYLFINSHFYNRSLILITFLYETVRADVIYKSIDNAVPEITYNSETKTVNFKSLSQCRGYLFKIGNISCG